MRIIAVSQLRAFWEVNLDAEQPLKSWVDEVKKAMWRQPADIKDQYRSASVLENLRVVFNTKGNDYRLVVSVACEELIRRQVCKARRESWLNFLDPDN